MALRDLTPAETEPAARLHVQTLPHGLFPALGIGFLARYYASFVDSPYGVALVAAVDERPVGVVAGTLANREHYRWVLRHRGLSLAGSAIRPLAVRPRTAAYVLRTRSGHYARAVARLARDHVRGEEAEGDAPGSSGDPGPGQSDAATHRQPPGVLTHLLVADEARGRGIGSALLNAFVARTAQRGTGELVLVTAAGEEGAGAFYARHGWSHRGDRRDWDGEPVAVYALSLR